MRLSEIPGTPFEIPKYGPIVYLIYCIPTKRAYVGSTVQYLLIRWNQHRSEAVGQTRPAAYTSASKLNRAIAKYGPDSFRLSILEETKTEKECRTREIWWIRKLKVTDPLTAITVWVDIRNGPIHCLCVTEMLTPLAKKHAYTLDSRSSMSTSTQLQMNALVPSLNKDYFLIRFHPIDGWPFTMRYRSNVSDN